MSFFAAMPDPPYYAVIFANKRTDQDDGGYSTMAEKMDELAKTMEGYIGIETVRNEQGHAITVSYWADEGAVKGWKEKSEHAMAQHLGKTRWYDHYVLRVAKVERHYDGPEGR